MGQHVAMPVGRVEVLGPEGRLGSFFLPEFLSFPEVSLILFGVMGCDKWPTMSEKHHVVDGRLGDCLQVTVRLREPSVLELEKFARKVDASGSEWFWDFFQLLDTPQTCKQAIVVD